MTIRSTVLSSPEGDDAHRVARPDGAADDLAGEPAEVEVRAVDPLHGQPERAAGCGVARRSRTVSRCPISVGPAYQGVCGAGLGDVVAAQRRHGDARDVVRDRSRRRTRR